MNDAKNYVHKAVKILEEEKKAHKKNRKVINIAVIADLGNKYG